MCELLLEEHAEIDFLLFLVFDELHSRCVAPPSIAKLDMLFISRTQRENEWLLLVINRCNQCGSCTVVMSIKTYAVHGVVVLYKRPKSGWAFLIISVMKVTGFIYSSHYG
ncbi:hypothetical protein OH492_19925 [Vibrio chagasii]|nr:hypothetical protein [Vibrio chagasii]